MLQLGRAIVDEEQSTMSDPSLQPICSKIGKQMRVGVNNQPRIRISHKGLGARVEQLNQLVHSVEIANVETFTVVSELRTYSRHFAMISVLETVVGRERRQCFISLRFLFKGCSSRFGGSCLPNATRD